MILLLVSKINDIEINQIGDSKVTIENKSADGSKIARPQKTDPVVGKDGTTIGWPSEDGVNKTVDIGKGKIKHNLEFFVIDKNENENLFNILYNERYCTIVDKFKGKIKVYVDSINIVNSDKYIEKTVYSLSCTVEDLEKPPSADFDSEMLSVLEKIAEKFSKQVEKLNSFVKSYETIDGLKFVDTGLDMVAVGIGGLLTVTSSILSIYGNVKSKIDRTRRLFKTLKYLKDFPNNFIKLVTDDITETDIFDIFSEEDDDADSLVRRKIFVGKKPNLVAICHPLIRGKIASQVDISKTSTIELENLDKEIVASQLVNMVKLIKDTKSILAGRFNTQIDFEATVNSILERLFFVGYEKKTIDNIIKSFANSKEYRKIIEINIKIELPLTRIVFELYGNLDNYIEIEVLNNLQSVILVFGKIKVFV